MLSPEQIPCRAIYGGELATLRAVLTEYPDLLTRDYGGMTLLHVAAEQARDDVDMVRFLVESGLSVDAVPRTGDPELPLNRACSRGTVRVARWLLDHGADIEGGGWHSPLCDAATEGRFEIVKLLVARGADVNASYTDRRGRLRCPLGQAEMFGHQRIADYLRQRGAVLQPKHATKAEVCRSAIAEHIGCHVGQVHSSHQSELIPTGIPIEVYLVPSPAKDKGRLVFTDGLSKHAVFVEEPSSDLSDQYIELVMRLPSSWPVDLISLQGATYGWPFRCLRAVARQMHALPAAIPGWFVTAMDEPPLPVSDGTQLSCFLVVPDPDLAPATLAGGRRVSFYCVVPIYEEERDLCLREGMQALTARLDAYGVGRIVELNRTNVGRPDR